MINDKDKIAINEINELVSAFVEGDIRAFELLYDMYADKIYRFVYFKTSSSESEDIVEIIFMKVWDNRSKYDIKKSSFSTWLYTIARNTIIDHFRVAKTVDDLNENFVDEENKNPKNLAEQKLTSLQLKQAILQLPNKYKDILLLRFIDDLSYAEIANILQKSEGSLRITLHRAIKELKKILIDMGFDQ